MSGKYEANPPLDTIKQAITALEAMEWVETTDRLPEKPGLNSYEYVDCLILVDGEIKLRPWNCEHLVWDDEHYDDFAYEPTRPTHWKHITPPEAE